MALTFVTYLWGNQYSVDYVAKLSASILRNTGGAHRFVVVSDGAGVAIDGVTNWRIPEEDIALTKIPGCFVRLRMFDSAWQAKHGIGPDDRLVGLDLDTVITGPLDPLFDRPEPFCILQGGNVNPCGFNGSLMMLRGGAHPEIWRDFTIDAASCVPFYQFPDDQGWLWHKLPKAAGWKTGPSSGAYVFMKPGWPGGERLPQGARYVTFAGWRDPSKFTHLSWVRENWR